MNRESVRREVFFREAAGGGRFCLMTRPAAAARGALLFVPPFAEELNKSRRMIALAAHEFARNGWTVLQMDLFGCGDSAGDFGDADWHGWLEDVDHGHALLAAESDGPLVMWTLRAGSLLAADWLEMRGEGLPLLLWQPVTSGKQHLNQFLRLKGASEMLADADAGISVADLRASLQQGQPVEVAGYLLSPGLAAGLDAAELRLPARAAGPVGVIEVCAGERGVLSPALERLAARWTGDGVPVAMEAVAGPAFWQSAEIETAPALIERSLRVLNGMLQ